MFDRRSRILSDLHAALNRHAQIGAGLEFEADHFDPECTSFPGYFVVYEPDGARIEFDGIDGVPTFEVILPRHIVRELTIDEDPLAFAQKVAADPIGICARMAATVRKRLDDAASMTIRIGMAEGDAERVGSSFPPMQIATLSQDVLDGLGRRLVEADVTQCSIHLADEKGQEVGTIWVSTMEWIGDLCVRNFKAAVAEADDLVDPLTGVNCTVNTGFKHTFLRVGFGGGRFWHVYDWPPSRPDVPIWLSDRIDEPWTMRMWLEMADDPIGHARRAMEHYETHLAADTSWNRPTLQ